MKRYTMSIMILIASVMSLNMCCSMLHSSFVKSLEQRSVDSSPVSSDQVSAIPSIVVHRPGISEPIMNAAPSISAPSIVPATTINSSTDTAVITPTTASSTETTELPTTEVSKTSSSDTSGSQWSSWFKPWVDLNTTYTLGKVGYRLKSIYDKFKILYSTNFDKTISKGMIGLQKRIDICTKLSNDIVDKIEKISTWRIAMEKLYNDLGMQVEGIRLKLAEQLKNKQLFELQYSSIEHIRAKAIAGQALSPHESFYQQVEQLKADIVLRMKQLREIDIAYEQTYLDYVDAIKIELQNTLSEQDRQESHFVQRSTDMQNKLNENITKQQDELQAWYTLDVGRFKGIEKTYRRDYGSIMDKIKGIIPGFSSIKSIPQSEDVTEESLGGNETTNEPIDTVISQGMIDLQKRIDICKTLSKALLKKIEEDIKWQNAIAKSYNNLDMKAKTLRLKLEEQFQKARITVVKTSMLPERRIMPTPPVPVGVEEPDSGIMPTSPVPVDIEEQEDGIERLEESPREVPKAALPPQSVASTHDDTKFYDSVVKFEANIVRTMEKLQQMGTAETQGYIDYIDAIGIELDNTLSMTHKASHFITLYKKVTDMLKVDLTIKQQEVQAEYDAYVLFFKGLETGYEEIETKYRDKYALTLGKITGKFSDTVTGLTGLIGKSYNAITN